MNTSDENMLKLFEILKDIGEIKLYKDLYKELNITKNKTTEVKRGAQHFTSEQIQRICELYNVNANWIYGLENNVFRKY